MRPRFDRALRASCRDLLRARLVGRRSALEPLPLDETLAALGVDGDEDLGGLDVPVDAIVGSVARATDFDRLMRPRCAHLRERWEALASVERDLPPVRLIRVGDVYFVEDGHHRVSVARARGAATVRACVRRICTVLCATRKLTVADLPAAAAERVRSEAATCARCA